MTRQSIVELAQVAALHVPRLVVNSSDPHPVSACACEQRFPSAGDVARRQWGEHLVSIVALEGGYAEAPHLETACRSLLDAWDQPANALDPFGYAKRQAIALALDHVRVVVGLIDKGRGA